MATGSKGQEVPVIDTKTGAPQSSGASTSLFNAFYVFKYSGGVDIIDESSYLSNNQISRHGAAPHIISNPTASAIVDWAKTIPANQDSNQYGIKNSPYTWSDFLFCKWYGIVPNNRLITLRKFPLASNDDAAIKRAKPVQNIPVAQAVTWFGAGTGNDLNKIWQSTWSLAWTKKDTAPKEVSGNNVTNFTQSLVKGLSASGANKALIAAVENLSNQADGIAGGGTADQYGRAKIEENEQLYLKGLWSDNGAFFNQIQGPVNVKKDFLIRDRGLSTAAQDANWVIIFEYKTDSYFGMSQKRVALDIIANMLALTYSDGEWLQSLNVYYKKLGLALAPTEQALLESAFVSGGLNPDKLLAAFTEIAKTRAGSILKLAGKLAPALAKTATNVVVGTAKSVLSGDFKVNPYENMSTEEKGAMEAALNVEITKALADSFPAFVQQRANVPNMPTGNWHLTIGNPMNPIMRIGDVIVRSCQLEFGEELGPEDFPIDLKFTVTLSPTRPRDSADIRQTFNLGRTDYVETFVGHTYDQANTYGIENKGQELASRGTTEEPKKQSASDARQGQVATWLNNRYGAGTADGEGAVFLKDVYFYVPPEVGTVGGSK
jgi:hypothetical protein